jgi:hypothetical protein
VLIVIRPGVQINAIKGDALRADGNHGDVRTHLVIEAVLIHAEVSRRVTQSNEARQELRLRILKGHRRPAKRAAPIARDELSLDANHGQRAQECQPNESCEFQQKRIRVPG